MHDQKDRIRGIKGQVPAKHKPFLPPQGMQKKRQTGGSAAGQRLKWQMHCAKGPGPPEEEEAARQHDSRVAETRQIAATCKKEGCNSCPTKVDNASEFLYTFTTRPGMDPTHQQPGRAYAEARRDRAQDTVRTADKRRTEDVR